MESRATLVLPAMLVVVGIGWLLTVLEIAPQINWLWTIGLAAIGIAPFLTGGFDKFSVVFGPFFIATSVLSILRQQGKLRFDVEIPLLVILLGVLMFVARLPMIPQPKWMLEMQRPSQEE